LLKRKAQEALSQWLSEQGHLLWMFSAKHDFPSEWHRFFQLVKSKDAPEGGPEGEPEGESQYKHRLQLNLSTNRFPYLFRGSTLTVNSMTLFIKLKDKVTLDDGNETEIIYDKPLVYDLKKGPGSQITDTDAQKAKFLVFGNSSKPGTGILLRAMPFDNQTKAFSGKEEWSFEVKETDVHKIHETLRKEVTIQGTPLKCLNPQAIEDLWIFCGFTAEKKP
jgi:hypothetical protein